MTGGISGWVCMQNSGALSSLSMHTTDEATPASEPHLIAVLKSRFEAIVREMSLVVLKASRSAVIKNARDLSCAILTYACRLVSTEEALPIHVSAMDLAIKPILQFF